MHNDADRLKALALESDKIRTDLSDALEDLLEQLRLAGELRVQGLLMPLCMQSGLTSPLQPASSAPCANDLWTLGHLPLYVPTMLRCS